MSSSSFINDEWIGNGIGGGALLPGIYLVGDYVNGTDSVTENASYTIEYFEILNDGTRFPLSGTNTQVETLALGVNAYTITGTDNNLSGTLYRADTFTITTGAGTAIGTIPTIESTISGGAWSITAPNALVPTYAYQTALTEGDNTVTMQYADANGDVFTSDNTVAVRYAGTAPILEIDGQSIVNDIVTEDYEVVVKYLYGGQILVDEQNEIQTDESDAVLYDIGEEIIEIDYALDRGVNQVQITGLTDDFENEFSTTVEPCTKIPHITNNGLTIIDEETYGTTYAATDILTIDLGAPYETTATPTEAPYTFTSGVYEVYNKTASYTYTTGQSNSEPYNITYQASAGYESDAVNMWLFDDPYVGDAGDFQVTDGSYVRTGDIISADGDFTNAVVAERLLQAQSAFLKNGATFLTDDTQQNRLIKAFTGNEGWFLSEHCFVICVIGPSAYGSDFEHCILANDFNTRVCQVDDEANNTYSVQLKSSSDVAVPFSPEAEPQVILVGAESGNVHIETSSGGTFVEAGFGGYPNNNMVIGFPFTDKEKQCNVLIHEITLLPYWPDATKRDEIFARATERWFEIPTATGGNTLTGDDLPEYTGDDLITDTIL